MVPALEQTLNAKAATKNDELVLETHGGGGGNQQANKCEGHGVTACPITQHTLQFPCGHKKYHSCNLRGCVHQLTTRLTAVMT